MCRRHPPPARRRAAGRAAAALCSVLLAVTACDRDVAVTDDDPLAVEAANAGMDAILLSGPTARRIAGHRLTVERVERWFAAQEALDAQAADDPRLGGIPAGPPPQGDDAIAQAVAALEARPGAEEAIEEAGLSLEEFVLTGLALHQALTASGPAAPAGVRRLAARNVRFVAENAGLLARFRTQRPAAVAQADPSADSTWWYDPFADSLVYGVAPATAPAPDTLVVDTAAADTLRGSAPPPDTVRVDTLRVDTLRTAPGGPPPAR